MINSLESYGLIDVAGEGIKVIRTLRKGIVCCTRCGQNVRETRLVAHHQLPECTTEVLKQKLRSEGWEKAPGMQQVIKRAGFEFVKHLTSYHVSVIDVEAKDHNQHVIEDTWAKHEVVRAVELLQGKRISPPRRRYEMIKRMIADPHYYAACKTCVDLGGRIPKEW